MRKLSGVASGALALGSVVLFPAAAHAVLPAGCSQAGSLVTCTYTANNTFLVPTGVTSLGLVLVGGDGGSGFALEGLIASGVPGKGSRVALSSVAVGGGSPIQVGQTLTVKVGGDGGAGGIGGGAAGTNGGAVGGVGSGGGGGATELVSPTAQRLLVAAGGGGAAGGCDTAPTVTCADGGNGGVNGADGDVAIPDTGDTPARGGAAGGAGGAGGFDADAVTPVSGGAGGAGTTAAGGAGGAANGPGASGGGGGGGGAVGGGGGGGGTGGFAGANSGGGGAGGTSSSMLGAITPTIGDGNQRVVITYTDPEAPVDTTAPTAQVAALAASHYTKTFTIGWTGFDNVGGSGFKNFDVRYRSAAWNGVLGSYVAYKNAYGSTTAQFAAAFGRQYCFSVRGRDNAANVSDWSTEKCTELPLDDPSITASPGWTRSKSSAYLGGTVTTTSSVGKLLKLTGVPGARKVTLVVAKGPSNGILEIRYSGTLVKKLTLSASTKQYQVKVALPTPSKTVTITMKTTVAKRVAVDGILIARQ